MEENQNLEKENDAETKETTDYEELAQSLVLNITDHAYERYVERVKGRKTPQEILNIIRDNKEKFTKELKFLYLSSETIYHGAIGGNKNNNTDVLANPDGWLLIYDRDKKNLVTLYKIELGTGDPDFDRQYVKLALAQIAELKKKSQEAVAERKKVDDEIDFKIMETQERINQLKAIIDNEQKIIDGLRLVKTGNKSKEQQAFYDYRNAVEAYGAKDKFVISSN